jgi:hypothetical protein
MVEITHQEFMDLRWQGGVCWKEHRTNPEDHVYTTTFTNEENNECLYYTTYPEEGGWMVSKYYKYHSMKGEVRFVDVDFDFYYGEGGKDE